MNAVALQIRGHEQDEVTLARGQRFYNEIPALQLLFDGGPDFGSNVAGILTRWRPSDEERAALAAGADIWIETMTFGDPLQPLRISVECPLETKAQG